MKNHAAATVRNRILKGAALCGVLALSMTLTGCFVPPDDLSGDLSNQGVVYNTVAVNSRAPKNFTFIVFFVILFIFVLFPILCRRTHYKHRQMFRESDILKWVFQIVEHIPSLLR